MSLGLAWATQQVLDLSCIERPSLTKQRRKEEEKGMAGGVELEEGTGVVAEREARGATYRQIPCHPVLENALCPRTCKEREHSILGILHRNLALEPPLSSVWGTTL